MRQASSGYNRCPILRRRTQIARRARIKSNRLGYCAKRHIAGNVFNKIVCASYIKTLTSLCECRRNRNRSINDVNGCPLHIKVGRSVKNAPLNLRQIQSVDSGIPDFWCCHQIARIVRRDRNCTGSRSAKQNRARRITSRLVNILHNQRIASNRKCCIDGSNAAAQIDNGISNRPCAATASHGIANVTNLRLCADNKHSGPASALSQK